MNMSSAPTLIKFVKCRATIKRKQPQLPRFVVVPIDVPKVWKVTSTITVTGTINGVPLGRRGLKPGRRYLVHGST
jgi:hypothetical protein